MSRAEDRNARSALVTGAARGLAQGIAADLAVAGYRVAFTYRPSGTPPDETLALIGARGAEALAIAADHAVEGQTAAAVESAQRVLGGLDVLVHAVGPLVVRRFQRSTADDYRMLVETNLTSAIEAARAALPAMRAENFGRLVFFGMEGSHATMPARGMSLYAAVKAGVVAFARTLAVEEARHGITVNVIEPGDIRDKTIDRAGARRVAANNATGHAGSWEDVAGAVRFLVADEAGFYNGMVLAIDGGSVEPRT